MADDFPTQRVDSGDFPTRRESVDDFPTVRGLSAGRKVFGRYVLETALGAGGMGIVWRAHDAELDEAVALKFLTEVVACDDVAVDKLKDEARHARRLTHPNIVRIYQFERDGAIAAVSMEFVDGVTLAKLRLAQPNKIFPIITLAPLVAQLCAALDYAHLQAKIVHRDLKPANILVTREDVVKVTDFGIARSLSESSTRLTGKGGDTGGTIPYMSPQQVRGRKPMVTDDLYSLGALLYELLTGKPPFFRGDPYSLRIQILENMPLSLAAQRAELGVDGEPIPPAWEETILACLAKEPEDRPHSAGEVAEKLGLGVTAKYAKRREKAPSANRTGSRSTETQPTLPGREEASASAAQPREFTVTVDPADAGARVWLGPVSDVKAIDGKAVLKNLPDGEQELTVQAPGYEPFTIRVTVENGRGRAEARLIAVKGSITITARPGTVVTAIDARGRKTGLGTVPASGVLTSDNLLTIDGYILKFVHANCAPVEMPGVELVVGRAIEIAPVQMSLPGELRVFSVPMGAEVRVNGVVAGSTPATIRGLPSECALRLDVSLNGYRRVEQTVTLQPKEDRSIHVGVLVAETGGIELLWPELDIGLAEITVDGTSVEPKGIAPGAPFLIEGLEIGSHTVDVTHPDYESWQQAVMVCERENTAVVVSLVPKSGTVSSETRPYGADIGGAEYQKRTEDESSLTALAAKKHLLPGAMRRSWFWLAAGLVVIVLGLLTYTFLRGHSGVIVAARPGTQVTAVDERGRETPLGTVPVGGVLYVTDLLAVGRYTLQFEHADCAAVSMPGVELVIDRTIKVAPKQALLPGELRVFSRPTGAEVRVNGTVVGSTPVAIDNQPIKEALRVEVYKHGYRHTEQNVTLMPKEVCTVDVGTLTAENGGIEFRLMNAEIQITDTQIEIDGRSAELQPARDRQAEAAEHGLQSHAAPVFQIDNLKVGSRTVEVILPGYEPWKQAVEVRDRENTIVAVTLAPKPGTAGTVVCQTTPAGAGVLIDGGAPHDTAAADNRTKEAILTPFRGALPPGIHTLEFELKGFKKAARTVTVAANRTVEVSVSLEELPPEQGQAWTVKDLKLGMAYISPGTFTMGSPNSEEGRVNNESPQTRVTLTKGYWLGKTAVTQGQWAALMGSNPAHFKNAGGDAPVEQVSWDDAIQFCKKLTARERAAGLLPDGYEYTLPTEAQWEYACRAGTTGPYGGSGTLDTMGWFASNSGRTTHPVAQKQANAWGLFEMHGNVSEWCWDWYDNYPGGSVTDPRGPVAGSAEVFRGGSWYSPARGCRSAFRGWEAPDAHWYGLGFRLALAPSRFSTIAQSQTQAQEMWVDLGNFSTVALHWIPPTSINGFMMGSPVTEQGRSNNEIQHTVVLTKGFWLGETVVTQGQWQTMMGTTLREQKAMDEVWQGEKKGKDLRGEFPICGEGETVAMYYVSWEEAMEFCRRITEKERAAGRLPAEYEYTLPTEAQWEYACRAGNNTAYNFGDDPKDLAKHGNYADKNAVDPTNGQPLPWRDNNADDGLAAVAPVGKFPANAWGLYDMHGNVFQWCRDNCDWDATKKGIVTDTYRDGVTDPVCVSGSGRIFRGGCWGIGAGGCRSALRAGGDPGDRNGVLGFRLALAPQVSR